MNKEAENLNRFINDCFDGCRKACALELKISESTLCRVLLGKSKPGAKMMKSIIKYCTDNNKNINSYVDFW